jgi:splicing factor 3B subunit 4
MAIDCMHNQFLGNRQITVQYAFKKDLAEGDELGRHTNQERHGSRAERMLAAQRQAQLSKTTLGITTFKPE